MSKKGYCFILTDDRNPSVVKIHSCPGPYIGYPGWERIQFSQQCDDIKFIMDEIQSIFAKRKIKKDGDWYHISVYSAIITLDAALTNYRKKHQKGQIFKNSEKTPKIAKKIVPFSTHFYDEK